MSNAFKHHHIAAIMLSCRIRLLVKNELKTPFWTASHAPQTGFFRFPIADSNLEIFEENEKFQMRVAALYGNKKKFRCQLPHLQLPVAALPYEKLVNSLLPHMQTHPLFTFLIVSTDSDHQNQQNFGTMYRNGRQIVSIIDHHHIAAIMLSCRIRHFWRFEKNEF